jgi:hypothetical protein
MCVKNKYLMITISHLTGIPSKGKYTMRNSCLYVFGRGILYSGSVAEGTALQRNHVFIKAV